MSKPLHPISLFRLSVLGPLASRGELKRGEIKTIVRELAAKTYNIPGSRRVYLSEKTIMRWYHHWRRESIEGLVPKLRSDKGKTQLPQDIQDTLTLYKKDNPARSINTLISLIEAQGLVARGKLSRATVHRFMQSQKLSKRIVSDRHTIERRSFVAQHAGDIWQGDVLHGPSIQTPGGLKKTYLVSLLDDASRLITHSAFCLGETALDIEGVLKQAVLKRGLPLKLILDNGPAYRSESLQSICAILEIRLIYCRPYEPEGKGKLERFHRTFRAQFLNEINIEKMTGLHDLNARLWAWIEQVYHQRPHEGLQGKTPLECWREDLVHVRPLGSKSIKIDDIFCHRIERTIRKDGTIHWEGKSYEVRYEHIGEKVKLVFDPHTQIPAYIESLLGDPLGPVTPLDVHANLNRKRSRPHSAPASQLKQMENSVDLAYREYSKLCGIPMPTQSDDEEK